MMQRKKNWTESGTKQLNELRFTLFQSDGQVRVQKSLREVYNIDCIQHTVKFKVDQ